MDHFHIACVRGRGGRMSRQPLIYGAVVFAAIFFVGWITGMGGSFLPNLVFSAAMGVLAGVMFALVQKKSRGPGE